ncbi:MAG: class I SAM-dependent methyltransferase [Actinomycetota bacterium]
MHLALYHPEHGYYARGPRSGWAGHYLTSAELDPTFGELWARGFRLLWESCGRPSRFNLIELGAGEGGFASAVLGSVAEDFRSALRYVVVEPLATLRTRQRTHLSDVPIEWVEDLSEVEPTSSGCVFANEVLDNLPIHLVEQTPEGAVELRVGLVDSRLAFIRSALDSKLRPELDAIGPDLPVGHRVELRPAARDLIQAAAATISRGALIFVDYGHEEEDLVARPQGTLMSYSHTGVDDRPLEGPGEKDITAHVNWGALRRDCAALGLRPLGPVPQRIVLEELGASALLNASRESRQAALAERRGLDAIRALSRNQALGALSDPGGLGRLGVFSAVKGITAPAFLTP